MKEPHRMSGLKGGAAGAVGKQMPWKPSHREEGETN
jgi:hypothetical protein